MRKEKMTAPEENKTPAQRIKFQIEFMLVMLSSGRMEEADTACQKALDLCVELDKVQRAEITSAPANK